MSRLKLNVNGVEHTIEADPEMPLLWALRDIVGLTGTKYGCGEAYCGACTVHLDGTSVKSCNVLAVQADGAEVTTIEGIAQGGKLHPVQEGFWECHGLQCGYCTPGMIMCSVELLQRNPKPTRDEIAHGLEGNLCRCTGYSHIIDAVQHAAKRMAKAK